MTSPNKKLQWNTPDFQDIHSPELASIMWDWSQFHDCFPNPAMSLSDIDGIMERNGYFLIIETKRPNVEIPQGQWILLRTLSQHENITVMIVWGWRNNPVGIRIVGQDRNIPADLDLMKQYIREWFQTVDNREPYNPRKLGSGVTDEQGFKWIQSLPKKRLFNLARWILDKLETI